MNGMFNLGKRIKSCLKGNVSISLSVLISFAITGILVASTNVYTTDEIDRKLDEKINKSEVYPKEELTGKLKEFAGVVKEAFEFVDENKANKEEVYTKKQADDKFITKEKYDADGEEAAKGFEAYFTNLNTIIHGKANSADVYTKEATDEKLDKKLDKEEFKKFETNLAEGAKAVEEWQNNFSEAVKTSFDKLAEETEKELDKKANKEEVYTKEATDEKLDTKADKTEVKELEGKTKKAVEIIVESFKNVDETKADKESVYTKEEVDKKIIAAATGNVDVYTKTEANTNFLGRDEAASKFDEKADKTEFNNFKSSVEAGGRVVADALETLRNASNELSETAQALNEKKADKAEVADLKAEAVKKFEEARVERAAVEEKVAANKAALEANKAEADKAVADVKKELADNVSALESKKADKKYVDDNFARKANALDVDNSFSNLSNKIDKNTKDIKDLRNDHNRAISQVAAMTSIEFDVLEVGEFGVGAALGSHSSAKSVALGMGYRPSSNFFVNFKLGTSPQDKFSKSTFGLGAVYKFKTK